MTKYRVYLRFALSGLVIRDRSFQSHADFEQYIGRIVLNSIERIEDIRYEIIKDKDAEKRGWREDG